jgi:hypothetical protein
MSADTLKYLLSPIILFPVVDLPWPVTPIRQTDLNCSDTPYRFLSKKSLPNAFTFTILVNSDLSYLRCKYSDSGALKADNFYFALFYYYLLGYDTLDLLWTGAYFWAGW